MFDDGKLREAYLFASIQHAGQKRKGTGVSYITHPVRVTNMIADITADLEMRVTGMLHDIIEDTDTTASELAENFGNRPTDLIVELTIDPIRKKRLGKRACLVESINKMTDDAFTIKLVDRFDNLVDTASLGVPDYFRDYYIKQTEFILDRLERTLTYNHEKLILDITGVLALLKKIPKGG